MNYKWFAHVGQNYKRCPSFIIGFCNYNRLIRFLEPHRSGIFSTGITRESIAFYGFKL